MTDRIVPTPGSGRFDLNKWFRDNVREKNTVHLAEEKLYWSEDFTLVDHPDDITIQGEGATLEVRTPPVAYGQWNAPFKVVKGNGLRVFDLNVKGCRPPGGPFDRAKEGQHGFTIQGAHDTVLCRVTSDASWGDGIYIADADDETPTTMLIVCEPTLTNCGRNWFSTVGAEDVLIFKPVCESALRTGFNFEVHPGSHVKRVEIAGAIIGRWGLNTITSTGSGEASDITFKDLRIMAPTKLFGSLVAGPGAEAMTGSARPYGPRRNWRIEKVRGGAVPKDKGPRFFYVDGLTIKDVPYPIDHTGSRLVP